MLGMLSFDFEKNFKSVENKSIFTENCTGRSSKNGGRPAEIDEKVADDEKLWLGDEGG